LKKVVVVNRNGEKYCAGEGVGKEKLFTSDFGKASAGSKGLKGTADGYMGEETRGQRS